MKPIRIAIIGFGKIAADHIVHRLIQNGSLRATGDGLFGDSQTYVPS